MNTIKNFTGEYAFLSNFYLCNVTYEDIAYPSAETAFQSAKCLNEKDRIKFKNMQPSEAKQLGKK